MPFFIIFVIIPLIEVALFAEIGGKIGAAYTLVLCVMTAAAGGIILRYQGIRTIFDVRTALDRGQMPVQTLFDGLCLTVAGVLLITPGFFTDALGFALVIPPIRAWLRHCLIRRLDLRVQEEPDILEGDFERLDDDGRNN
ncbi:MAG: FxsA family protein [Proteobacteria bacterium]|nr:FxsA family protein [Pseudomonadota bacterium]